MRKHHLSPGLLLPACVLFFSITVAAQKDPQETARVLRNDVQLKTFAVNDQLGTPSFLSFKEGGAYKLADVQQLITRYFDLSPAVHATRLVRSDILRSGVRVDRYKQTVKGILVEHSSYVVTSRDGNIISISAESYPIAPGFSISPSLTADAAKAKALDFVKARKYAWDAVEEDKARHAGNAAIVQKLDQLLQEYRPKGELVIAKDLYGNGRARLAWKFNIYAVEPLSRSYIYIDAIDGRILLKDAIIKHAGRDKNENTTKTSSTTPLIFARGESAQQWPAPYRVTGSEPGTAQTRYAGTRQIYTTRVTVPLAGTPDPNFPTALLQYSGVDPRIPVLGIPTPADVFILKDDTRGGGIETYDMNGAGGLPLSIPALATQALAFVDKDNNWKNETTPGTNEDLIRGATSNGSVGADEAVNDDYAMDAHWGAEMVYDYWKTVHNRFSYDNLDGAIRSFVHYGPAYDNAFWNGSVMTYGDGSGTSAAGFRPLTSLDVCGHEIGHGVCTFTSDLVYERESGAMNEGLSDIWAACVERFVKTTVAGASGLPYEYFQVGEQIAADNVGLRRMDNPKAKGDPDTYGGVNWQNPECGVPNLANDQCGVHGNSGVLNKWFYLLVQGPGTTTGTPAYTDDGIADNGAIANAGNNYGALGPSGTNEFIGLGFSKAEAITYLMELTLTPNAKFADARIASINAARILYGECSQEERSVTDAWYAVGVGPSYASCILPPLVVSSLLTDIRETAGGLVCDRFTEYNINVNLTVVQPTTTTVNLSTGAGTLSAAEYTLTPASIVYNPGESGLRTAKLRIYDDAMLEGDEAITIIANCASPVLNTSFNFTIHDDDNEPVIGGTQTLLNETFESLPEGPLGAPTNTTWGVITKITPSPVQWSVRTDGVVPSPLSFTTKRAIIEMPAVSGEALYDQLASAQVILRTPLIDATGLNSVRIQFVFQAGGEPACEPACDYGELLYSLDGVNFTSFFGERTPMYIQLTDANFDFTLPASFNGKQFYLGVMWNNDANAGTTASVTLDNFIVTAKGRAIESELNATVSEKLHAETGKPVYFYSTSDGELSARLVSNTSVNYGCVSTTIEKAGNGGFQLYVEGFNSHRVMDKIVRFAPAATGAGNYTITLYYTEQEIQGFETFIGLPRTSLFMYKTTAALYTGANAGNTERVPAAYTAIPGAGGYFTASFNGLSSVAVTLGASVSIALPVNCTDFKAIKGNTSVTLQWKVENENDNNGFDIERSYDGSRYSAIANVPFNPANNGVYSFLDNAPGAAGHVFYRLKQHDKNGRWQYACGVLKVQFGKGLSISPVYPNPAEQGEAYVNVMTGVAMPLSLEYINAGGQLLRKQPVTVQAGTARITLHVQALPAGLYMIRFRNREGELLHTAMFTKK